jgi:cell division protein FtsL
LKFILTEQQYCDIEKQLITSNEKLKEESSANEQLRQQIAELGE